MSEIEIQIQMRECKNCKIIKEITQFKKQYNKKLKNPGYSHKCTKCIRLKRKPYHDKYYIEVTKLKSNIKNL